MKIKIILILFVILAAGGGIYYFTNANKNKPVYEALRPERKDITVSVSASGTINAFRNIEVKSKASGNILRLLVNEGDTVKKNQLILELDKTDELSKIRQARASLMSAEAKVSQAQEKLVIASRSYSQQTSLASDNMIPEEQLLQAQTNKNLAIADLKIAQASLINAQEDLKSEEVRFADTAIRAPVDGLVLQKSVEEGQIISSGLSATNGGTLILILGDITRIIAKAEVDEVDISKIQLGQAVNLTVDAYDKRSFAGVLTHISPQGTNKSNVTVFNIEIEVTDQDKNLLKPGMTATAEIIINKKEKALTLPLLAVSKRKSGYVVYKKEAGDYVPVKIEKGIENDTDVEIVSGISEDDTLYIKPRTTTTRTSTNGKSSRRQMSILRPPGGGH